MRGLSGQTYYEVQEGESVSLTCMPLPKTVALDWELPHPSTVVQYQEPLRHTLTIHGANINHNGNYTCSVVGDETSSITAYVRVFESKIIELISLLIFKFLSQDVWKIYQVVFSGALPLTEIQCQDHAEMLMKALGALF